jgi:hypothetical protein
MPSFKVLLVHAPADLPGHIKSIQAEKVEMESLKFLVQMRSTSHRRVSQWGRTHMVFIKLDRIAAEENLCHTLPSPTKLSRSLLRSRISHMMTLHSI